jgi:hypothetical protein
MGAACQAACSSPVSARMGARSKQAERFLKVAIRNLTVVLSGKRGESS